MKSWHTVSCSSEQTQQLGERLGQLCPDPFVLLLEGDLGSGKTCFTQGVARGLEVPSDILVNSPTYTLMNQYPGRADVSHFDLYRLDSSDDLLDLDFDTYLYGNGIAIVEWAGRVDRGGLKGLSVSLEYGEHDDERILKFNALDRTGETLLKELAVTWKENC